MEEQLLCAVVHEFGPNFAFAADVLAACSQLQGIFRRASQCKEKFKQLTVSHCDLVGLPGHSSPGYEQSHVHAYLSAHVVMNTGD